MNFKKRTNFLFGVLLLTGSLLAQNVCVSTPKTSLVLSAPEGGTLRHLYMVTDFLKPTCRISLRQKRTMQPIPNMD